MPALRRGDKLRVVHASGLYGFLHAFHRGEVTSVDGRDVEVCLQGRSWCKTFWFNQHHGPTGIRLMLLLSNRHGRYGEDAGRYIDVEKEPAS